MVSTTVVLDDLAVPANRAYVSGDGATSSGVSWAAIFAGAAASAALSLILLVLGTGLGLSAVSPWAQKGIAASLFGVSTIVWIGFTAIVASGLGGYLAGRLRIKWASLHTDEVYFRDTAHGFLAWAVATLVTAGLLTSAIGTVVSAGTTAVGTAAVTAAGAAGATGVAAAGPVNSMLPAARGAGRDGNLTSPYLMDALFRPAAAPAPGQPAGMSGNAAGANDGPSAPRAEVGRIFANSMRGGALPADDVRYAGQLVAQHTGLSQADAEKRVTDLYNGAQAKLRAAEADAKDAADQARRATAYASLWIFVSLLLGAFSASLLATVGGRRRDLY
ncbi:MAG: hypothetical protein ABI190_11795 [Casimicrobiaceae bacterium]